MKRRDFLKQTPLAVLAGIAGTVGGTAQEIDVKKRYCLTVPYPLTPQRHVILRRQLKEHGLENTIILDGEAELKEI